MGDRCYMTVMCKAEHAALFEDFVKMEGSEHEVPGVVELEDHEANPDPDSFPHNIPWVGRSESGSSYGPYKWACDGQQILSVPSGFDGGFVVTWDRVEEQPDAASNKDVCDFIATEETAWELLKAEPLVAAVKQARASSNSNSE